MDLAAKLQLKGGQRLETVLLPSSVTSEVAAITPTDIGQEAALIVFVCDRAVLETQLGPIVESATRDRLTWVAYPKSGQLDTDLNRDSLAALLRERGVQPVRQVAIDDIWSALRFRPA